MAVRDLDDYPWDAVAPYARRAAAHPGGAVDLSIGSPVDATPAVVAPAAPSPIGPVSRGYRRYALLVLLAVYTFNFLDRQILAILAEPIKHDLDLKDWQLGLLTGLAFALLYTLLGIPIATWSERGNRPWIIGGAVTICQPSYSKRRGSRSLMR